jgi:hypothetical protein
MTNVSIFFTMTNIRLLENTVQQPVVNTLTPSEELLKS